MSFNLVLADLKQKLSAVQGLKTCAVGIEANLSPADYPLVRIVPNQFRKAESSHYRICDLYVYFGLPLTEGVTSIESIYSQLLEMEQQVIEATRIGDNYRSTYQKTIVSGSEVEHYRLMVVVLETQFS